ECPPGRHRPVRALCDDHPATRRPAQRLRNPPDCRPAQWSQRRRVRLGRQQRHHPSRRRSLTRVTSVTPSTCEDSIGPSVGGGAMAADATSALYDRLGWGYSIATVVDDFINRIMADPRLNANPRVNEAHHRVAPPGFKYLVTEMICWAAGGPQSYTGRSMKESHQELMITADEWEAFVDDLRQT